MSRIRVLPEVLSNKIAAGEVVERPASVVKELLENAIDAGSTSITVEISQGGRSLIRVSDNGEGMNRDDALLAIERYATSKIRGDRDLYSISTLGFRGEALPSIAAVSKFTLVTKDRTSDSGTRIYVEGGKIKDVREAGAPDGTMVSADQLFFNTPARRKFLKTANTEIGHIADAAAGVALAWKDISFRLFHNGRMAKNWPSAARHFDRAVDVLGSEVRSGLYALQHESDRLSISGWISDPGITRSTAQKIYIYVNGRLVRDRGVYYAILEGYRGRLMKGRYPVGALFFRIPPEEVDVNVHPTKHEVRFSGQKEIYRAVREAVAGAFSGAHYTKFPGAEKARVEEEQLYPRLTGGFRDEPPAAEEKDYFPPGNNADGPQQQVLGDSNDRPAPAGQPAAEAGQQALWQQPRFSGMSVIGQFQNTYIICESEKALYIIDQHAAHERIVYERLTAERKSSGGHWVQMLAVPETLELGYRESAAVSELIPDLENVGILIEPFGGRTFIIKSLPSILADKSAKPLVTEIAETAAEAGYTPGLEETINECLTVMACHGAIRANHALSGEEIRALLQQLDRCENPCTCPHGRPTFIQWPLAVLEKRFKRTV